MKLAPVCECVNYGVIFPSPHCILGVVLGLCGWPMVRSMPAHNKSSLDLDLYRPKAHALLVFFNEHVNEHMLMSKSPLNRCPPVDLTYNYRPRFHSVFIICKTESVSLKWPLEYHCTMPSSASSAKRCDYESHIICQFQIILLFNKSTWHTGSCSVKLA